jgi:hypothetical protein
MVELLKFSHFEWAKNWKQVNGTHPHPTIPVQVAAGRTGVGTANSSCHHPANIKQQERIYDHKDTKRDNRLCSDSRPDDPGRARGTFHL